MSEAIEARAFEAVSKHARFAELVAMTRGVALRAAKARTLAWQPLALAPEAERGTLREVDAETDFGNAWTALEGGPKTAEQRALLRALWAHVVAEKRVDSADEEDALAARVTWLAAFTPFDATLLLDRALGEASAAFWPALGERLRRLDAGEIETTGRAEALAATLLLRASESPAAIKEVTRLAALVTDPVIKDLLEPGGDSAVQLRGEVAPAPRHPAATIALAVTGVLFFVAGARLLARLALAYRRPAEVTLSGSSVHVRSRTLILGRTVRERDVVLARQGITRAVREVRYARAAFYAGLFSLAVGSLLGVRTFVDGVRAASPSLLFYGLLIVAVGIGLDFLLASLGAGTAGKCQVVFVGRDGVAFCVGKLDTAQADEALAELARPLR